MTDMLEGAAMISDVLLQHPWLAPTAFALLVVLGPPLAAWLVRRPHVAWVLVGLSLVPVLALTLVPVQRRLFARCTFEWSLPTPGAVEAFANLLLFVPPVLLAGVACGRPVLTALAGSGFSALIEAVQALLPVLGRSCDTSDWLSNTLGAAVGALLAVAALVIARRSRTVRSPPH